jgi:purine nucleoside phosphorylase
VAVTGAVESDRLTADDAPHTLERVERAADVVRARFGRRPDVAVILGTGLGGLASGITVEAAVEYAEIPGFPLSTVESHAGRLLCGTLAGKTVDMSEPYDGQLRALARAVATEQRITLREGVYVAVPGPNLETRAEYRFLRGIGADVVGMSTVPEVIVAVHAGMRVLGVSIITDQCLPDALEPASVEKIIAVASRAEPNLTALVSGVLERL